MKICLDTHSLINIIEKSPPLSADDFENELKTNGHELILSLTNILEISAPLFDNRVRDANVIWQSLISIEKMPVKFIESARLIELELKEALKAFTQKREYQQFSPFVDRFVKTLLSPPPICKKFLKYSLAETIFDLLMNDPEDFNKKSHQQSKQLQDVVESSRKLMDNQFNPNLRDNFVHTIRRNLSLVKLPVPSQGLEAFAKWIYKIPTRCPSIRLGYEVFHYYLRNKSDASKQGDMGDLSHLRSIPYVDLITLDRRMSHYAGRVCDGLGLYKNRIKNMNEIKSKEVNVSKNDS